ncbi:MAG: HEXXH motif-containing putative peptide modification protein [Chloroflexi bacterium]|nr:HEXXH motif-containing putative peptide modification protein [Chloroflexota bacterium]
MTQSDGDRTGRPDLAFDRLDPRLFGTVNPDARAASPISALPEILRWRDDHTDLFARINSIHSAFVRGRIAALGEYSDSLNALLSNLPVDTWRRIELAPEVFRLLAAPHHTPATDVAEILEGFCSVELYISGHPTAGAVPNGRWSALGDVCVVGDPAGAGPTVPSPYRRVDGMVLAPTARGTVIDGYSPTHSTIFGYTPWAVESHPDAEFEEATDKVSAAMQFIESVSEPTGAMLDACLRVVSLARVPADPNMTLSGSHPHLRGSAGFSNLHSLRWAPGQVAEALLHESIHSLISKMEIADSLFSSYRDARNISATSPWSGRALPLWAYVHACFLWFGSWHFWQLAGSHSERANDFAETAARGFADGASINNIPPDGLALLRPDAIAALQTMTQEIAA